MKNDTSIIKNQKMRLYGNDVNVDIIDGRFIISSLGINYKILRSGDDPNGYSWMYCTENDSLDIDNWKQCEKLWICLPVD